MDHPPVDVSDYSLSLLTFTEIDTMEPAEVVKEFVLHTDMHVFLTGKAGTGKTTLLRKIADETQKNICLLYTSPSPRDRG